ncbi:hypothetical protein LTR62_003996 [Meristemomyces frigidus]|uniref:Uncharacterized protein n=1 Tax=Meristemomyces frigidus TaxID=1508187 RepID=A0AAN7YTU9_9PEZI|nr:hypothetical protein LTR62_003996 [Meristemomyces frigidus]
MLRCCQPGAILRVPQFRLPHIPRWPLPLSGRVGTIHAYATITTTGRHPNESSDLADRNISSYPVLEDKNDVRSWAPVLETCLPPQLRLPQYQHVNAGVRDGVDKARIISNALGRPGSKVGVDLLYDLGVNQERWEAVVWLVKSIVDSLGGTAPIEPLSSPVPSLWHGSKSLAELTDASIEVPVSTAAQPTASIIGCLDMSDPRGLVTSASLVSDETSALRRDALGTIWRSLGAMIIASTNGAVRPEVLEIIAYLHHSGIMPASIYSRKPRDDESAIQQPPTLHLLSSRILSSLSDAAWRAHEKSVLEQARATGYSFMPLRPEIPGSAYRVRVPGLRAEIWLELILWSCLHGEWMQEGLAILDEIYNQSKPPWRPISWRAVLPTGLGFSKDWDKLNYTFNTQAPNTMDQHPGVHDVKRSISSEVMNAYVDALLSELDDGQDDRYMPTMDALTHLNKAQAFLDRSDLKLGGGSWDAVMLRFFDSRAEDVDNTSLFRALLRLSPGFGGEVKSSNTQQLPSYVRDGSAAAIGIGHQILQGQIKAGSVKEAFSTVIAMRDHTDHNKKRSIADFFRSAVSKESQLRQSPLFTGNYDPIDYPAFQVQIPSTILGQLLELATTSNEFAYAKWLLYSDEVDGPLIPESLYSDDAITPAIVHLATASRDGALLGRVVQACAEHNKVSNAGSTLSYLVLVSFFGAQVSLRRWDAARKILQALSAHEGSENSVNTLVLLARAMILLPSGTTNQGTMPSEDMLAATSLFQSILERKFAILEGGTIRNLDEGLRTLGTILATLNTTWYDLFKPLLSGHFPFRLRVESFNTILEAVAESRGATAAAHLLTTFWPWAKRNARKEKEAADSARNRHKDRPRTDHEQYRTVIRLSGINDHSLVMYKGVNANQQSIRIVLRCALAEISRDIENAEVAQERVPAGMSVADLHKKLANSDGKIKPLDVVVWALRALRDLGMVWEDVLMELEDGLSDQQLRRLRKQVPHLFTPQGFTKRQTTYA